MRLWRCGADFKSIEALFAVPVKGFVNALAFSEDGKNLVAVTGQEHRLGRWQVIKEAKNQLVVIPLQTSEDIFK